MRVWARMLAGSSLAIRGRTTGVAAALKCGRLLALRALTLFLVCNVGSPRHSQLWRSQESFIGAVALSMWVWLPRWVCAGACNVRVSSGLSICGARLVRWAMRHQPSVTEVWWAAGVVGVTQQSHDALLCATRWQGQASVLVAGMLPSKGCA